MCLLFALDVFFLISSAFSRIIVVIALFVHPWLLLLLLHITNHVCVCVSQGWHRQTNIKLFADGQVHCVVQVIVGTIMYVPVHYCRVNSCYSWLFPFGCCCWTNTNRNSGGQYLCLPKWWASTPSEVHRNDTPHGLMAHNGPYLLYANVPWVCSWRASLCRTPTQTLIYFVVHSCYL